MDRLPARGAAVRELGLTLPPERLPLLRRARLRKQWRYVGYYSPELMLCVGAARIGPVPQRWWALAEPDGRLRQRTSLASAGVAMQGSVVTVESDDVRIRLELEESEGVETASPVGDRGSYVWTRKQAAVAVRGSVEVAGSRRQLEGEAFVDESAGYHSRHTSWSWSAGNGRLRDGRRAAWNLVTGIHDAPQASERSIWLEGEPREIGPVEFAGDLSWVAFEDGSRLAFSEWSAREERMNLLLLRNVYRQPFGTFSGTLPGGLELAEGYGVMEEHDVYW